MQRDTTLNNELDFPELDFPELDLHGHPIHPAWLLFKEFVIECDDDKCNRARIITGRGKMLKEFTSWATNHPKISTVYLEANGGSFIVQFFE